MNKKQLVDELEKLGVAAHVSWKKERLEALLEKARRPRPDRTRDASRQKGV